MEVNKIDNNKFTILDKLFAYIYCCCFRPELTGKYINGTIFERVTEPCRLCPCIPLLIFIMLQLNYIIEFAYCDWTFFFYNI